MEDGCLQVAVFSKEFCSMNGTTLPVVRAIDDDDDDNDARKAKDAGLWREILMTSSNNSGLYVTQPMRRLTVEEYAKVFKSFLNHSTEHQCMEQFNKEALPSIAASLGNGKSSISVLGVGSGTGEQDLKMIKIIQAQHPGVFIKNEVIEPNPQHILAYKGAVRNSSDLKNVSFTWHQLTSMEYEKQAKEQNVQKKYDFIHLIQMLYRVEDITSTIRFFHHCLDSYAKLLIIILSGCLGTVIQKHLGNGPSFEPLSFNLCYKDNSVKMKSWSQATLFWEEVHTFNLAFWKQNRISRSLHVCHENGIGRSGWASLWKKYRHCLPPTDSGHYITADDIKATLEGLGLTYQVYEFPSAWDITECFTDGDAVGGHMLDFLTGTKDFMNTAPDGLKQSLWQALSQPECSTKKDGRILFRNDLTMIVVDS